jgi:hypothetical protein
LTRPSRIHSDEAYRRANVFKDRFQPRDDVDYAWIQTYSREVYSRLEQADQTLDTKAESIIKLLGGGTGLLALGALINAPKIGILPVICICAALLAALFAIFSAAWVRVPRESFLPPSIAWAISYAHRYAKPADQFLGQWHLACEGMRLAVLAKAAGVRLATWLAVTAILFLALSFIAALFTIEPGIPDNPEQAMASATEQPNEFPPAPAPSGIPQTPDPQFYEGPTMQGPEPARIAGPQSLEKNGDPSSIAGPQIIRHERTGSRIHGPIVSD